MLYATVKSWPVEQHNKQHARKARAKAPVTTAQARSRRVCFQVCESVAKIVLFSQVSVIFYAILTLPIEFFDENRSIIAEEVVAPEAVNAAEVLVATLI